MSVVLAEIMQMVYQYSTESYLTCSCSVTNNSQQNVKLSVTQNVSLDNRKVFFFFTFYWIWYRDTTIVFFEIDFTNTIQIPEYIMIPWY